MLSTWPVLFSSKVTKSPATKKFGHVVVMPEIKVDTICGPSHKPKYPYCPLWEWPTLCSNSVQDQPNSHLLFQYGPETGDRLFLETLAKFLAEEYQSSVDVYVDFSTHQSKPHAPWDAKTLVLCWEGGRHICGQYPTVMIPDFALNTSWINAALWTLQ